VSRVEFEIRGREVYRATLTVRVNNLNYAGHLGNDAVLTLCHEARVRFLQSLGASELDFHGPGIVITDAMVIYRSEGRLGDQVTVTLYLDDIGGKGFDIYYDLSTRDREIARVKTGVVFFDYRERKVVDCPAGFLRAFD
jgi:acyl-CoA thioester hydrolase